MNNSVECILLVHKHWLKKEKIKMLLAETAQLLRDAVCVTGLGLCMDKASHSLCANGRFSMLWILEKKD